MRSIIMRAVRWPLHSPLRLLCVVAALVVLGVVLSHLNDGDEQNEAPVASSASDGQSPGVSDGGGSESNVSDGGGEASSESDAPDTSDAETVTTKAVSGLVTRDSKDSTDWKKATKPYVAPDVLAQWDEAGWKPAKEAPLTVDSVTFEKSDELGADTEARWERIAVAHVVNGDDVPREFPFRVEARKGQDGWVVTRLVSLEGVDE